MSSKELKEKIQQQRQLIRDSQRKLGNLLSQCSHEIVQKGESALCDICGQSFGWWCPDSPDHLCEYSESPDFCDFCGDPDERK